MLRAARSVRSFIWNHPSNRKRRVAAVLRALRWQLYKRTVGGYWDVRLTEDRVIRCYPDSTSGSSVLYAGLFDYDVMHFLLRYLREDDNFLDVGANIGVYTVLASSVIAYGEIHALEPSRPSLTRLQENIRLNALRNVRVHPVAAAERSCTLSFTKRLGTVNHVVAVSGSNEGSNDVTSVDAATLDSLVGHVSFAMGKMDIEGYELPALRGARRMLGEQNPPVWVMEVGGGSLRYGYRVGDLVEFMGQFGYSPLRYGADEARLRPEDRSWKTIQNALFVSGEKRKSVDRRLQAPAQGG